MFSKEDIAKYASMPIEDGNHELKEFYKFHMSFLRRCSLSDFERSDKVMYVLAVKLHNQLMFRSQWKIYATEMGVTDNTIIAIIEESANAHNEMPLYITMTRVLKNMNGGKLDNIIKALLNMEEPRYDALEYLRPHVQKLLDKRNTSVKRGEENINSENSTDESESFQCLNSSEHNCEELPMLGLKIFPSASLTVFIQHTEHDSEVAKEISIRMKKFGIVAKTSNDVEHLLLYNSDHALSTILREVDFIVPVVSKQFFQQIHPHMYEKCTESLDAKNNKTLYELITTQYKSKGHVNFKVRPVLLPDMDRELLTYDVLLYYGLRLWTEFPKLVRILKETKDLISQHPLC